MKEVKSPLYYGEKSCEALMHKYEATKLPPENTLFYHQGVFLSGMQKIYRLNGNESYFNYIKEYVDSVIGPNGELTGIDREKMDKGVSSLAQRALELLDSKQPTILLYDLFDKTGEEKYANAIKKAAQSMHYYPVNSRGGYWHMLTQPYQMWLDGAYMAGPLSVMYAQRFGDEVLRERAVQQVLIMDEMMKDEKTGLYFHGWDESKKAIWADQETGLSQHIWGRAVGWYAVAILDILEFLPENHWSIERLKTIERELLKNVANYQDEKTGLWYNVMNYPEREDNWVESSATNLFIYSYAKAVRIGIVERKDVEAVIEKAYNGIVDRLYFDDEGYLVVDDVCAGTCISAGTYEHYIKRPRVKNDLHGVGAFLLMCAEMEMYFRTK